jgi:hypothetical protein
MKMYGIYTNLLGYSERSSIESYRIRMVFQVLAGSEWGEAGFGEASSELSLWILNREVYLEVDDNRDPYNRLVCVVYIIRDSTNYVNVNEVMVRKGYAEVWDHPNRFNPHSWNQVIEIPSRWSYFYMGIFSILLALIITFIINRLISRINKRVSNFALFRKPK